MSIPWGNCPWTAANEARHNTHTATTTTTSCLTVLYLGWPGWDTTRRNIHSLTPCLCGYYTTSLINFFHFLCSIASYLHICCIGWVFFYDLTPSFLWPALGLTTSTSKSMIFFTQSFSSFLKTCPYYLNLCHCITVIIQHIPNLSLNSLLENLSCYFNATHPPNNSHLSPLKCQLTVFLHWPRFIAMSHITIHITCT